MDAAAIDSMTTKQLCEITGVSEASLRRWLKDGQPVPELADAKRDWRGWRTWEQRHVEAIQRYQQRKQNGAEGQQQLTLFGGRRKGGE